MTSQNSPQVRLYCQTLRCARGWSTVLSAAAAAAVITKHRNAGYKLGEFQYKDSVTLVCVGVTQSLYKHKILRTYNKNFEL